MFASGVKMFLLGQLCVYGRKTTEMTIALSPTSYVSITGPGNIGKMHFSFRVKNTFLYVITYIQSDLVVRLATSC